MNKNLKFKIKNYKRGFGLIEVIVSTSIILIVAGAALGLGRLALKNSVISYERTQAYNLAREAMETIRNQRDYQWSQDRSANFGLNLISEIESTNDLRGDINLEGTNTIFSRDVQVTLLTEAEVIEINDVTKPSGVSITPEYGCDIIVTVSWKSYGKEHKTTLSTILTDWKPADVGW